MIQRRQDFFVLPLVCATPPTPHVMHRCGVHDLSWYWYTFLASAWCYAEGLVPLYSFLLLSVPAIWIMPGLSYDRKYSNGTILLREYYHTLQGQKHHKKSGGAGGTRHNVLIIHVYYSIINYQKVGGLEPPPSISATVLAAMTHLTRPWGQRGELSCRIV